MGHNMRLVLHILLTHDIVSAKDIQSYFDNINIKTIYHIIDELNIFFYPLFNDNMIIPVRRKGYMIQKNIFEQGELQFLIDSILSNRDLSGTEQESLVNKLLLLSHITQKEKLLLSDYNNSRDISLMRNISTIIKAISLEKNISFQYINYDIHNHKPVEVSTERHVSPYRIHLDNNHYYLICFYKSHPNTLTTFRIDRMRLIKTIKGKYTNITEQYDMDKYIRQSFSMFLDGKPVTLKIECHETLLREIVSRFGGNVYLEKTTHHTYIVTIPDIVYSRGVKNWILMLGSQIKIISPYSIQEDIKEELRHTLDGYV